MENVNPNNIEQKKVIKKLKRLPEFEQRKKEEIQKGFYQEKKQKGDKITEEDFVQEKANLGNKISNDLESFNNFLSSNSDEESVATNTEKQGINLIKEEAVETGTKAIKALGKIELESESGVGKAIKDTIKLEPTPAASPDNSDYANIPPKKETELNQDQLFNKALRFVVTKQRVHINSLKRELGVGILQAQELINQLEKKGIVGEFDANSGAAREVLVDKDYLKQLDDSRVSAGGEPKPNEVPPVPDGEGTDAESAAATGGGNRSRADSKKTP